MCCICFFFFQAEDGIRDRTVTGVQTCALPIYRSASGRDPRAGWRGGARGAPRRRTGHSPVSPALGRPVVDRGGPEIGRAHVCSSHRTISYAVFCLKKKKKKKTKQNKNMKNKT